MRISELLQLPVDCLTQDARGVHYLRYMQGKVKRENAIPISLEIARIIQEQQAEGRNHGKPSMWLFPNERGDVIKQATFAHRINRLAYDHDIRDATGKLFRFQSHQFRHTVGTRMINLGVPHHIIQRYLGHRGPEMTSRYAHIHDSTMQDKLSEYLKGTLIDVTGKAVPEEGMNDSADLQWFTRSVPCAGSDERLLRDPNRRWPLSTSERLPQLCSLPNGRHFPRSASSRTPRDGASHRESGCERLGATK
jgi:Phage integrase family